MHELYSEVAAVLPHGRPHDFRADRVDVGAVENVINRARQTKSFGELVARDGQVGGESIVGDRAVKFGEEKTVRAMIVVDGCGK